MSRKKVNRVKVGDQVRIIAGAQKDLLGNVLSINTKKEILTVDTIAPRIKRIKAQEGKNSNEVEIQIYTNISNVMLWDKEANMSSKIGYKQINSEKKRYFKKSGNIL